MCLAEALLRIPDHDNGIDFVIDKLSGKSWADYLSQSKSLKAACAAYGLCISGAVADLSTTKNALVNFIARAGQSVFLVILKQAIRFLGKEFVFATNIEKAIREISNYPKFRFAFDLLGESARTLKQADDYFAQYLHAISTLSRYFKETPDLQAQAEGADSILSKPNLSVKLTALYPRFEWKKKDEIDSYLIPKLVHLVEQISEGGLSVTFDAEEASRLDIYVYTITKLLEHSTLRNFNGIGLVVQSYRCGAYKFLDHIIALAKRLGRKIPIRLVKGAYWDLEIKRAQESGLNFYPVFTDKEYTDVSYIACAKKMLSHSEFIYPQFATHNAMTASTIIELSKGKEFEMQKLHGMGKILYEELAKVHPVRIYAPIGQMNDLLAYLMRRMLENGANGCFVNKVKNANISAEDLAYDLYKSVSSKSRTHINFKAPRDIFPDRKLTIIHDLGYSMDYQNIEIQIKQFLKSDYKACSIIDGRESFKGTSTVRYRPGNTEFKFSEVFIAGEGEIEGAINSAQAAFHDWSRISVYERADILNKIADLYEKHSCYLYALLMQEAGKTIEDAVAEVAEAIDFCRYYANSAQKLFEPLSLPSPTGESNVLTLHPRGIFLCISPWNFPLAIFTGQVVAALVCGNTVIAKPADQTCVIGFEAVKLMHQAGVPGSALQYLLARGSAISEHVIKDERVKGVVFTGSTATAKLINRVLAERDSGIVPFIAETGGLNAMIADSSALLEQLTDDVITSAFGSAGQRCSALRMLYVQDSIYEPLKEMLTGAMNSRKVSDSVDLRVDIGPVIDKNAYDNLNEHVRDMISKGFKPVASHVDQDKKTKGHFFYPHIIEVSSIKDIGEEKFGAILHIAKYKYEELDQVIEEINSCGYGLTFGIHSRIESRIDYISSKIQAGNIYANRSMIGAKVGSQPFGGENKSGTGFKAGGPYYLLKFVTERTKTVNLTAVGGNLELLSGFSNITKSSESKN
jgi:RHH-type proline utilization regulon transcriptional repressor/proline dehydrogenase/delta 1-pyrroline-5-carboxylate dehydrogenase